MNWHEKCENSTIMDYTGTDFWKSKLPPVNLNSIYIYRYIDIQRERLILSLPSCSEALRISYVVTA